MSFSSMTNRWLESMRLPACAPATPAACSRPLLRYGRLRRRPMAPSRPLVRSATCERPAGILASMPHACPSPVGGSLRSRRGGLSRFRPKYQWGAKSADRLGRMVASLPHVFPPPVPGGEAGEKGKGGIAVDWAAPVGRSRNPVGPSFLSLPSRTA
jgi:hypothetical protein